MQAPGSTRALEGLQLCLDFTDTISWRLSNHAGEVIKSYKDLVDWSQRKGIIDPKESPTLLRTAKEEAGMEEAIVVDARALREAIYGIFLEIAHGSRARTSDVEVLNHYLGRAMAQRQIQMTESGYTLGWRANGMTDKMLYPIAESAAELLISDQLDRLRECANEEDGCGSLFIDGSKSRSRRWCSMESCGNKVKLRAYYQRHKKRRRSGPLPAKPLDDVDPRANHGAPGSRVQSHTKQF